MDERDWLAERFEAERARLRTLAYRMLGSVVEADDALQEAWLRVSRAAGTGIENPGGWLTTVVARVCLDLLRARRARREAPAEAVVDAAAPGADPEQEALLGDAVGLALLVVLDSLAPAERVAFVLHDLFDIPFEEIAPVVGRTPTAARQLASRARRRVRGAQPPGQPDLARRRELVRAFLAASRDGDFAGLLALLDPDVVFRSEEAAALSGAPGEQRGAEAVARIFCGRARGARPALVDGAPAFVWAPGRRPRVVFALRFDGEKIAEIRMIADPQRLERMEVTFLQR